MALEKDIELIDDYLSNRMTGDEKNAFEKRMLGDQELSNELTLQKSLVEGIRHARVVELKTMLNSIPVTTVPTQATSIVKVGSWILVGAMVATATYFYFQKDEETIAKSQPVIDQKQAEPSVVQTPETKAPIEEKIEEKASEKVESKPKEKPIVPPQPKQAIKVYEPSEEVNETATKKYEQEQLEVISKAFVTSSIEVETNRTDKKYNFHYVFNEGRLVLYGNFEKNFYEILEFIGEQDKRTVVLYYKENYYLLDINKTDPTLLTPIKNRQLLKKLHEYRGK